MRKMLPLFAGVLLAAASLSATAREVDFVAKIVNATLDAPSGTPRIVGLATFTDSGLAARGAYTYTFTITNADTEELIFQGSSTITSAQTTVDTGNANIGRITLTYDATTDQVEVRVIKRISALGYNYTVRIADDRNWFGRATVITTTIL